ncbi:uncharacterized protein [Montipora capricornis]|uniref:uncharacterized protein n=1 Tax=Montipora capricornis TaxID=246305 RepID=UPI0035F16E94
MTRHALDRFTLKYVEWEEERIRWNAGKMIFLSGVFLLITTVSGLSSSSVVSGIPSSTTTTKPTTLPSSSVVSGIPSSTTTTKPTTLPSSSVVSGIPSSTTTTTTKPTTILYDLDTDYTPIIAVVAAGFGGFIVFVCCMCVLHSFWLKKKKFTNVNSRSISEVEKKRRKKEEREAKKKEKEEKMTEATSRFDMAYRKPPTVNERALANYDWARTSHLPGMLEPTVQETHFTGSMPKLICDDDDSDPGEENEGYNHGQENQHTEKSISLASFSTLFPKEEQEESVPQEPIFVEPQMFESMEELPRPPVDGVTIDDSAPTRPGQENQNITGSVLSTTGNAGAV